MPLWAYLCWNFAAIDTDGCTARLLKIPTPAYTEDFPHTDDDSLCLAIQTTDMTDMHNICRVQ